MFRVVIAIAIMSALTTFTITDTIRTRFQLVSAIARKTALASAGLVFLLCFKVSQSWCNRLGRRVEKEDTTEQTFYINKAGYYKHWRIFVIDGYSTSYVALREVDFIGFLQP